MIVYLMGFPNNCHNDGGSLGQYKGTYDLSELAPEVKVREDYQVYCFRTLNIGGEHSISRITGMDLRDDTHGFSFTEAEFAHVEQAPVSLPTLVKGCAAWETYYWLVLRDTNLRCMYGHMFITQDDKTIAIDGTALCHYGGSELPKDENYTSFSIRYPMPMTFDDNCPEEPAFPDDSDWKRSYTYLDTETMVVYNFICGRKYIGRKDWPIKNK